jgi:DNA-binding response OmpR family regulator
MNLHSTPPLGGSLDGRVVLIMQGSWRVARNLADAFEAKGAQLILAGDARFNLAELPRLSAALLDSDCRDLCRRLKAARIPFLFYTARDQSEDIAPVIRKPAPVEDVLARVELLLA